MSGTHDSALRAKKLVLEKYPRARIEILDSKTNCMALGLQVIEAAIAAQAGKRMEEVMEAARNIADKVQFYFVPASLKYLQKGGRIGGASALIGSLLKIRPILYVNNGITDLLEKVRGTRSAVKRMTEVLNQEVKMRGLRHLLVHHINDEHAGKDLAACLGREYGREVASFPIGPVIGLHVGPGTVGIVFCTET
jgi:DegV family protein with EDD domain